MVAYSPSERIQRLRARALDDDLAVRKYQGFRGLFFSEGFAQAQGQPLVIRRAQGLANVVEKMPAEIREDELLVGHHDLGNETLDFPEFRPWSEELEQHLASTLLSAEQRARYKASAPRSGVWVLSPLPWSRCRKPSAMRNGGTSWRSGAPF